MGFFTDDDRYEAQAQRAISFMGRPHAFYTRAKVDCLLEILRRRGQRLANAVVLDLGCGPGLTDAYFSCHVKQLHGADIDNAALHAAARRNPGVHYIRYDGRSLPYRDGSFDLTLAVCVMHHVPPAGRKSVACEMYRVTRQGGLCAVFEHNPLHPLTRLAVRRCAFDRDARLFGMREAVRMLKAAGFHSPLSGYLLFQPFGGAAARLLERFLCPIPLGAQYYACLVK